MAAWLRTQEPSIPAEGPAREYNDVMDEIIVALKGEIGLTETNRRRVQDAMLAHATDNRAARWWNELAVFVLREGNGVGPLSAWAVQTRHAMSRIACGATPDGPSIPASAVQESEGPAMEDV